MAKVQPELNFVNLVEAHLLSETPAAIQLKRDVDEFIRVSQAARRAQPTEGSDKFPFYDQEE